MKSITYNSVTEGPGLYKTNQTHDYRITGTGVVVGDKYLTVDHVVSQYEKVTYFSMTASRVEYSQRLITGDSGSGLFDKESGRLMGINYYNIQTMGLVKPIDVFMSYLEGHRTAAVRRRDVPLM